MTLAPAGNKLEVPESASFETMAANDVPPKSGRRWSEGTALAPGERYPVRVGERVLGKYVIERVLAIGAMTVVAVARVEGSRESESDADAPPASSPVRVAIKVMREARVTIENTSTFLRDARAMSSLKSSYVPKVFEVGMLSTGLPYFVMELLEGFDLETLLARDGVFSPHVAIEYILQACEALTAADRVGVKHNDLKLADLFLTHGPDGTPLIKLLGLGVAKTVATKQRTEMEESPVQESWRGWLHDTTLMGAPLYKAPEQLRAIEGASADPVDARADVWALGAIMFELVTGHSPFGGDTVEESITKILERPAPALELYIANAPYGFTALIHRCLEKDRARRFVAPGILATKLRELVVKPSVRLHSGLQRSTYPSISNTTTTPLVVPVVALTLAPPRRSRRGTMLAIVVALVAIAIGVGVALPSRPIEGPAVASSAAIAPPPPPPVTALVPASSPRSVAPEPAATIAPAPVSTPKAAPRRAPKPRVEASPPPKTESLPSRL